MANLIQATVTNVAGNPLSTDLSQAFLTSGIIMQDATVASSPTAVTKITYFSGPFSNIEYYVTETVTDLIALANTGTTSMVQVTVYEINGYPQRSALQFGFPASGTVLRTVVDTPIVTIVTCAGINYGVSETEDTIVTAANVGGGGGGAVDSVFGRTGVVVADAADYAGDYVALTGTSTAGGNMTLDLASNDISLINANSITLTSSGSAMLISSIGALRFDAGDGDILLQDLRGTKKGIEYSADYSANYTARSLVDKAFVLANAGGSPGGNDTQVQFNNAGAFGASSNLTFASNILSALNVLVNRAAKQAYPLEVNGAIAAYDDSFNFIVRNSGATGSLRGFIGGDGSGAMVISGATNQLRIYDYSNLRMGNNISISAAIAAPAASATLDLQSTTQGLLPPRMTTTQKNAISSPAEGLTIYDLSLHKLCVYTGSAWETVTSI